MNVRLWLAAAVVQGVAVLIAGWLIWRRGQRHVVLAAVLIAIGLLILAANALWVAAGGASPIGMLGGMPGLWLSNLTAVELLGLALLALGQPRR